MKDFDNKIGFWIKNLPYIWKEGENIHDCERFYIINSNKNIVVFDNKNIPFILSSKLNSIENKFSLLPFRDDCHLPRQCFQVWIGDKKYLSSENVKFEGNEINISEIEVLSPEKEITIVSKSFKEKIKIHHEISNNLNFYCGIYFRDKLSKEVIDCIFSLKNELPPYVIFEDINFQIPYKPIGKNCSIKYNIHRGQCKLFLGELQFLTKYIEKHTDTEVVIYPGGCPAHHLWYLIQFFPNIKFISIDPNPCELYIKKAGNVHFKQKEWNKYVYLMANSKSKKNIKKYGVKILGNEDPSKFSDYINNTNYSVYFIQDIMTIPLSEHLKDVKNALYISDIRTQILGRDKPPQDIDIIWNLSQQYNWISILKPRAYMLKFRHPFHEPGERINFDDIPPITKEDFKYSKKLGIDFLGDYKKGILQYLDGTIYIQSFPPVSSTETRLHGTSMKIKNYGNGKDYDAKFRFYNTVRNLGYFYNPLANKNLGFDHCGDCSLEYNIWKNYADKYNKKVSLNWISGLSNITRQYLLKGNHGYKFEKLTLEKYRKDHNIGNMVFDKNNKKFKKYK